MNAYTTLKKYRLALSLFLVMGVITSVSSPANAVQDSTSETLEIGSSNAVWKQTVSILTRESLWSERDAYDASHVLMIPMHFAFVTDDVEGVKQFENLMARFARQELSGGQLNQAQWIYLVSRYLALRAEFNWDFTASDRYLARRVAAWLHNKWMFDPAYQWERLPLFGEKERFQLILDKSNSWPLSYYPAITDYELFLFAAASDLIYVRRKKAEVDFSAMQNVEGSIEEMARAGITAVRQRGTFTKDGGWLFQVGIWTDHPDYRYAGHSKIRNDLEEKRIVGISEDSSHSHRWPLFFRSMISASGDRKEDKDLLFNAYSGFSRQFVEKVVFFCNNSVLLKNYMDGSNGLYRYKYATVGSNEALGYAPSTLSGILGEGWYPFLIGTSEVYDVYVRSYPLRPDIIDMYVGPNTTRARNPMFVWPDFFMNGFSELIARQARYLSEFYPVEGGNGT